MTLAYKSTNWLLSPPAGPRPTTGNVMSAQAVRCALLARASKKPVGDFIVGELLAMPWNWDIFNWEWAR